MQSRQGVCAVVIHGILMSFVLSLLVMVLAQGAVAEKILDVPYMRQPDGSTCMPTSLLMALEYFGKDTLSEQRIFELHRRTRVNRLNIPAILHDYGMHGDASYSPYWTFEDIKQDIDDDLPVVLGTDISDAGHIILAVGYTDDGRVIVHDPGYQKVGYVTKTLEEVVFDGGGVRFREVPVGPYQAEWVAHKRIGWVVANSRHEIWFEYRNRGTETWRAGQVELRPTGSEPRNLFYDESTWISPDCIARLDRDVKPGETHRFTFSIQAPDVATTRPFCQPFHLFVLPETPFSYPRDQDISIEPRVWAVYKLPLVDRFPASGPELGWTARFTNPQMVPRADDPMGDGAVLRVQDTTEGGYDSIRIGNLEQGDYRVRALLYCRYRPDIEDGTGFERIGFFARDRYRGEFEKSKVGNCYLMTHDSNNGRIICGKVQAGEITDFLDKEVSITKNGWHEFRIDCQGNRIRYFLDKRLIADVEDDFRSEGQCGVGYHEFFSDNDHAQGTLVARFSMEPIEKKGLARLFFWRKIK